jgi:predicted restriction endonuclease
LPARNAHIRPTSGLPDSAALEESMISSNVLKLCPNHHVMYDSSELELKKEVEDLIGS